MRNGRKEHLGTIPTETFELVKCSKTFVETLRDPNKVGAPKG